MKGSISNDQSKGGKVGNPELKQRRKVRQGLRGPETEIIVTSSPMEELSHTQVRTSRINNGHQAKSECRRPSHSRLAPTFRGN